MYHMLSCFSLKPGVPLAEFCAAYDTFVAHMLALDLIAGSDPVGVRDPASPLDTDETRNHTHFALMHFTDKKQSEAAYDLIKLPSADTHAAHLNVFKLATDMVFIAWEDCQGPSR